MAGGFFASLAKKRDQLLDTAETHLRVQRLKGEVANMRKEKEEILNKIATRVYDLFNQGQIQDQELLSLCQQLKIKQWELDEKWSEINHVKSEKG
ncbi:hypothetical protein IJT10_02435 [bacterium]|nr:hypothetical protein [bacterium]